MAENKDKIQSPSSEPVVSLISDDEGNEEDDIKRFEMGCQMEDDLSTDDQNIGNFWEKHFTHQRPSKSKNTLFAKSNEEEIRKEFALQIVALTDHVKKELNQLADDFFKLHTF